LYPAALGETPSAAGYCVAMSEEDVEILREGFEAFARGDVEAVLERLDPDVGLVPAAAHSDTHYARESQTPR
jgi:ketosteroid isomerase-like protein